MYLRNGLVAGIYFVFKCARCGSQRGGVHVFESKIERVYAFDVKVLNRGQRSDLRAQSAEDRTRALVTRPWRVGEKRIHGVCRNRKGRAVRSLLRVRKKFLTPLLSEYQVQQEVVPGLIECFGM
jgi:hypothetical protein